jgi:hypothetical protein
MPFLPPPNTKSKVKELIPASQQRQGFTPDMLNTLTTTLGDLTEKVRVGTARKKSLYLLRWKHMGTLDYIIDCLSNYDEWSQLAQNQKKEHLAQAVKVWKDDNFGVVRQLQFETTDVWEAISCPPLNMRKVEEGNSTVYEYDPQPNKEEVLELLQKFKDLKTQLEGFLREND